MAIDRCLCKIVRFGKSDRMSIVGFRILVLGIDSESTLNKRVEISRMHGVGHILRMACIHLPCHILFSFPLEVEESTWRSANDLRV